MTTDVGQHQMWAAQSVDREAPRSFLSSGGLGTMGFGFPAAIGAAIGCPEKQVVCVAGDGSFQMNSQEMATASIHRVPVKVLILDNRCLGMVHQWQKLFYDERYSSTLLDASPDFVKLAEAYGWRGERVEKPADVDAALARSPSARICISASALETLSAAAAALTAHGLAAQVTQIAVSRTRPAGGLHLLMANNPVFLVTGNCE